MHLSVLKNGIIVPEWYTQAGWLRYNINNNRLFSDEMEVSEFLMQFENISSLWVQMPCFRDGYKPKKVYPKSLRKKSSCCRYKQRVTGDCIMKVHRFQFEVMWLMLAVLGCWARLRKNIGLIQQLIRQESLQKKPPSPIQIRPPPLFAWVESSHIK